MTHNTIKTIKHYSQHAQRYFSLYDSLAAEEVHADWSLFLATSQAGRALDVGAGSGRDANWLAKKGWQVVAVEPADNLCELAQMNTCRSILWSNACLPELAGLATDIGQFDLILLSAVWMHLPAIDRPIALTRLAKLLSDRGKMYISLRFGPSDDERPMYPVSFDELHQLAAENGLVAVNLNNVASDDRLKRNDVTWVTVELTHTTS